MGKISDTVLGFLAEHFQLKIVYSLLAEEDKLYEATFFLKTMPVTNEKQKKYITEMGIFQKEIAVYKNLISVLLKLTDVPFTAQYYFSNDNVLVLEDLNAEGFQNLKSEYTTLEQSKQALDAIARLHASSIVLEELHSTHERSYRIDKQFPEEIVESTFSFTEGHPRNKWLKTATDCLMKLYKYFGDDEQVPAAIKEFAFGDMQDILKPSKVFRNCVTHDDLWMNNLMFNGSSCFLVDFQLTRYTPPILDVLLFLIVTLPKDVLDENVANLLDYYYDVVSKELKRHNLNGDKVFPKREFMESVEFYKKAAYFEAALYGTNIFLPEDVSSQIISNMDTFEEFTFKNRAP